MTSAQAQNWAQAPPQQLVWDSMPVQLSAVICAVCLRDIEEITTDVCLGRQPDDDNEHLRQTVMTAMVTGDDARTWSDTGANLDISKAQSVAVLCLLCGQSANDANHQCPERTLWQ